MSIDAMKQALAAIEAMLESINSPSLRQIPFDKNVQAMVALRAAIEQTHDWDEVEALRESLREHMAEIHRLQSALEQEPRECLK